VVDVLKVVAQYGGFPAIIMLGMAWALYKLWVHTNKQQSQMIELQNVRVSEAKEVRSELMEFNKESNKALAEMSSAIGSLKDAILMKRD